MAGDAAGKPSGDHELTLRMQARTREFAVRVIRLAAALPRTLAGRIVASQLVRSGTSVGANYRACCRARSRAEFIAKMSITIEEADEAEYWLEIVVASGMLPAARVEKLLEEARQLVAIFARARATARARLRAIRQSSPQGIKP